MVHTGLDVLFSDAGLAQSLPGRVAYLCHAPSVDRKLVHGLTILRRLFGDRLAAAFAPQHGLAGTEQDNMIESGHFFHPHYRIPVYSLYSEQRQPSAEMLAGIDHLVIDLQDVGARVYTYIWTMVLTMQACGAADVEVVVLDRPNPLGGEVVEGNVSDPAFASFIGLHPMPLRHGLTIGEIARLAQRFWNAGCRLRVVPMRGWRRSMLFDRTGLPWVLPSPNLPTLETAVVYPATVFIEGTGLSEGRGTTRPFELIGHPRLDAFALAERMEEVLRREGLAGCAWRPTAFTPVFEKHRDRLCQAVQLHVTDRDRFQPWLTGQLLLRELYAQLGDAFEWRQPPFEYEYERLPIDILHGADTLRKWVEAGGEGGELRAIEQEGRSEWADRRREVRMY